MTPLSIFKRARGGKEQIDIQEAFNIFNLLRARYVSSHTVQLFKNFVHDREWDILLDRFLNHFGNQIAALEKEAKKFSIIVPIKPPLDIKIATSLNEITDEYIYKKAYHDFIAELMSLIHAVRTSSTNDNLRNMIIQDLKTHLKDLEALYKFGKLKGWEDNFPIYKTSLPHEREQLSTVEAFHILDHINLRYEQIELAQLFLNFAHDTEFKAILQHGLYLMNKQVSHLEQLALKYHIMLPNRPAPPVMVPIDPETIKDKFMYNNLLGWVLNALDTHVRAAIETIRNDSLRNLWRDLFTDELEYYDKYLKYGKMKGWTRIVPIYGEPV
ncbi:MAG: DUF3231 family protein [Bacillota bacterium]|nr:DUF3231 family protein [Bacillota bacterium]